MKTYRYLLTGMTAQQVNPQSHRKSVNFAGLLWEMLRAEGHEVYWQEPSVEMTPLELKRFDRVIVGVAPVSALGANRAYGALSVIDQLWGDRKLSLMVDAPDPIKIQTALRSVVDHPENLIKPFFSYRKEYNLACEKDVLGRLLRTVERLAYGSWPNTIVPGLPWHSVRQIENQLPDGASGHVRLLNLDHVIFDQYENLRRPEHQPVWAYEKGSLPGWQGSINLSLPVHELPNTHRTEINTSTISQLANSLGCLIGPSKAGTWWSPRYAMALSQLTPVFSVWHETQWLGSEWTYLPGMFETLNDDQQRSVAVRQYESYVQAIPDSEDALAAFHDMVGQTRTYNKKGA